MTSIIIASVLLAFGIVYFFQSKKDNKKKKQYIELDRLHAKHLSTILDYQLVMFDCIAKTDYYGAGIAHQSINDELKEIEIILDKKAQLIS